MAQQEAKYADPEQVWKIWVKDGKDTPLQFTTPAKLKTHKEKYQEIYDAVFGKVLEDGTNVEGIYDKIEKYVMSQGQEGEASPTAEVGDYIIGIRYFEDSGAFTVSRKPKSQYRGGSGYKPAPLLTLESIHQGTIEGINSILQKQQAGEIYRFSEIKDGQVTVLKLRQVN
jgi:hypothetical protein